MTTTRARACQGKKAHTSREDAEAHRRRKIAEGAHPDYLAVYRCTRDGAPHWHVGHVGRRRRVV